MIVIIVATFTGAVLKNSLLTGCTEKAVKQELMLCLRNAPDRNGGRKKRAEDKRRNEAGSANNAE